MLILTNILGGVHSILIKRMPNFLKADDIIKRIQTRKKVALFPTNKMLKHMLQTICQNYGNNFVANIIERNQAII